MAVFLSGQLDFIFFLYGLAFILLGGVCFAILDIPGRTTAFGVLGSFGIAHGLSEWLDLIALLVGDTPTFALLRTLAMTGSFLLLLEFARRQALQLELRVPGPWLYAVLVLLVVAGGVLHGPAAANAVARYATGFVGAMATAWVFTCRARAEPAVTRRIWLYAAAGFFLYGIAAGAVVPAANFWPTNVVNYAWFTGHTGMPIQLVRCLLACWITVALWVIWKRMVAVELDSARFTASQHNILVWTLIATGTIVGLGWTLTQFLGGIYQRTVEEESAGDVHLLASLLTRETATLGGAAGALAGSPSVLPLLTGASAHEAEIARSVLDLEVAASGARSAYIADRSGIIVASSGDPVGLASASPEARAPAAEDPFAFDTASAAADIHASRPIVDREGSVIGAAVLTSSLQAYQAQLGGFHRTYFLVDADGVVMATNRPEMSLRSLWPAPAGRGATHARQSAPSKGTWMAGKEIEDATWIDVQGRYHYVRRQLAEHSRWSLVLLMPDSRAYASRFLGIIITLLVSIMMMIYLYGRERLIRDRVELENRLNLRDVARNLELQATTDPLTGLFNRLKFNEALGIEMARSKRQKTPLSLMLYDVDHFKAINDNHGHQAGDAVLVQISQWVLQRIRPTDLLARWGGEEFIILAPGSDGAMAYQAADRLRSAMQQVVFETAGTLSCSFGVSQYVEGDTAQSMLARADAALYRAKIGGRNRVELAA